MNKQAAHTWNGLPRIWIQEKERSSMRTIPRSKHILNLQKSSNSLLLSSMPRFGQQTTSRSLGMAAAHSMPLLLWGDHGQKFPNHLRPLSILRHPETSSSVSSDKLAKQTDSEPNDLINHPLERLDRLRGFFEVSLTIFVPRTGKHRRCLYRNCHTNCSHCDVPSQFRCNCIS